MMRVEQVLSGYKFHQLLFNLDHVFAWSNAGAVAYPENMRVYGHRQLAKSSVENNVCGFAADTGERLQRLSGLWYFACVMLQQQATGLDHVPGFAVKQANCLDVFR